MLRTAEIDMGSLVTPNDVNIFVDNVAWDIHSTYLIVLEASPGAAILGCNMRFDILFVADTNKIVEHKQHQTNHNTAHENSTHKSL
jgi:hypothetical protein